MKNVFNKVKVVADIYQTLIGSRLYFDSTLFPISYQVLVWDNKFEV